MTTSTQDITTRLDRQHTLQVAILVFPGVEVLDFAGPFEVFSVASRVAARDAGYPLAFKVALVAASAAPVMARHGLGVLPHHCYEDAPAPDLLIVPGGVMDQPLDCPATLAWVRGASGKAAVTASVCTGAFLLAKLGLLDGLPVTTHWEDIPDLLRLHPALEVRTASPYVDTGRVVTSAGISAGIGMSLHLVRRALGAPLAAATARQMEYDWTPAAAG